MKSIFYILGGVTVIGLGYFIYTKVRKDKSIGLSKVDSSLTNILFVGDSLTAGFGLNGNSFVDKVKSKYPNVNTKKIAITGKQTGWMLQQLEKEISTGKKYDVITIWGGVNDIYATNSINGAKNNLQRMYDLAKDSGAKVVAINVIPTATYKPSTSEKIKLTNDLNRWIKSNNSIDTMIDVNSIVSDGNNGTKNEFVQSDKLHLNNSAQSLVANDFYNKVIK